jgi:hypothetical protein
MIGLNGIAKLRVFEFTENLMSQAVPRSQVLDQVMAQFSITEDVARRIYSAVNIEYTAVWSEGKAERAKVYERNLMGLYRIAMAKESYGVAERVIARLGRMWGVEGTLKVSIDDNVMSEFEGRTGEELQHFITNGYWPHEERKPLALVPAHVTEGEEVH